MNHGLVRCKVREGRGRRHRPVRSGRRLPSVSDFFSVEAGTFPGSYWKQRPCVAVRVPLRSIAGTPAQSRGLRVCAWASVASIWHYKDKRKQTQKRSGLLVDDNNSPGLESRALRSAWKRGGWGRYFGLLYVTEWPLSAASSSDSDTACAIIRGPLVAVSYAKYFQVAG